MLYYDRIDVSKGIDINKTGASKECDVSYHWYYNTITLSCHEQVCLMRLHFEK